MLPYAGGPSENALAYLKNGSIIIIFRVAGESGHHNPYVSKVSDDHGLMEVSTAAAQMEG